jgi:hypothetical protein
LIPVHVWLLLIYVSGTPDVLSVHASLGGCERAQRAMEASTQHGPGLIYACTRANVAP